GGPPLPAVGPTLPTAGQMLPTVGLYHAPVVRPSQQPYAHGCTARDFAPGSRLTQANSGDDSWCPRVERKYASGWQSGRPRSSFPLDVRARGDATRNMLDPVY